MGNNIFLLCLIFIIKLLVFLGFIIYLLFFDDKNEKIVKNLFIINLIFILSYLLGNIFNIYYLSNSTIKGIISSFNSIKYSDDIVDLPNSADEVESIETNEIYKNNRNNKVFYFNNQKLPLSNKKITCNNRNLYMKNFGNNITAISILLSTLNVDNNDPIQILNYALNNNLFDCNNGVDTDKLLQFLSQEYQFNIKNIDESELIDYIKDGNIVLAKISNINSSKNLTCDNSNIILYNINNENNIQILNPSDRDYDYICPENSPRFGTIIKANSNDNSYSLKEISSMSYDYIAIERD